MVLSFDEALQVIHTRKPEVSVTEIVRVALLKAWGRVLAQPIVADRDQPPFDRATRDGFAVRAEDWNAGQPLRVIGTLRAGESWTKDPLHASETIETMTGAPVPSGANAVAMIEHVERTAETISATPGRTLQPGENIVYRGKEAQRGSTLLLPGTLLGGAEIALAAACGYTSLDVHRRPRIAILATGDELVELDALPEPHQIRNSNSYGLTALVESAGGKAIRLPIAPDERGGLLRLIEQGRRADLLILSGGVSMGQYDLVEEALETLGAEFFFTGVKMQPGKPVVFGRLPATHDLPATFFFGLPGNPVSTQVTFHAFVAPVIRALAGSERTGPPFVLARLAEDVPGKPGLTRLLPGRLTGTDARLVPWQGSGDLAANARANCYMLLPADHESFRAGEIIRVLLQ